MKCSVPEYGLSVKMSVGKNGLPAKTVACAKGGGGGGAVINILFDCYCIFVFHYQFILQACLN